MPITSAAPWPLVNNGNSLGQVTRNQVYSPYGETHLSADGDTAGFTGHRNDADTGLVYMQARYYDPISGRFLSTDPVTFSADRPAYFNRYWYAGGNPMVNIDKDGRCFGPVVVACIPPAAAALADAVIFVGSAIGVAAVISEQSGSTDGGESNGEGASSSDDNGRPASVPTGSRGNEIEVEPGTNEPTEINGREYSGHAQDRMQGRGVPPSAVEEAIQNGEQSPGNEEGTTVSHDTENGVRVVTNSEGKVITVTGGSRGSRERSRSRERVER